MDNDDLKNKIEKEIECLRNKNLLEKDDSSNNVGLNHYSSEEWADGFWRRRVSHARRPDPEIEIVFETNPCSILEIGSAYGRILKKLSEEKNKRKLETKLYGIELCKYLEKYFTIFKEQEPSLQEVELYYDNFFNSTKLKGKKFDVILLSMNTFPEFGPNGFPLLFRTVTEYLADKGLFIFSAPKYLDEIPVEDLLKETDSGELSLEEGEDPIVLEVHTQGKLLENNIIERIKYFRYYRFTKFYKARQKFIYRITGSIVKKGQINKIIEENGFKVEKIDDKSHSFVFICKKS